MTRLIAPLLAALISTHTSAAAPEAWSIDPAHSRIVFTVTKWGFVDVEGPFTDFDGTLAFDPSNPTASRISVAVRVASVVTGDRDRDESLGAREYFDGAAHPVMRFESERVERLDDTRFAVRGRLTLRGASRPLSFVARHGGRHAVPHEGTFEIFETSFVIDRYDFGIVGGPVLGPAISSDVRVALRIAARRPD